MLGAQALAITDLGTPYWDESSTTDYSNQPGIGIGKMIGFKKPVFHSAISGSDQDFGVLRINTAR